MRHKREALKEGSQIGTFKLINIVKIIHYEKDTKINWLCRCAKCNTEIVLTERSLRKQIKCKKCEGIGVFVGQKFSKLIVVSLHETREYECNNKAKNVKIKKHRKYFLCKCDCGNTRIISAGNLTTGKAKSCGCLR